MFSTFLVVVGAVLGLAIYHNFFLPRPSIPASKRFGLAAANAAKKYLRDKAQANAVLAVVVGVLGYENTVAVEALAAVDRIDDEIERSQAAIGSANRRINDLKNEIADREDEIKDATDRSNAVKAVADMFSTEN